MFKVGDFAYISSLEVIERYKELYIKVSIEGVEEDTLLYPKGNGYLEMHNFSEAFATKEEAKTYGKSLIKDLIKLTKKRTKERVKLYKRLRDE